MNESRMMDTIRLALRAVQAGSAEVSVGYGSSITTRMADNIITQNVRQEGHNLSVSCAYGNRHGGASTNDLSDESIRAVVRRAEAIAKVARPDPEFMPPLPATEARKYLKVEGFVPAVLEATPRALASSLAAAARKVRARKLRLSGAVTSGWYLNARGNSAGLRCFHRSSEVETHMTALGAAGSGWAQESSHDPAGVNVGRVAAEACEVAARAQHPGDLPPGKHTVIMQPAAAAEFMMFVAWAGWDAKATDEGRTFLRGKLGKRIFGPNITLRTDPTDPRCPGGPFDWDGLAMRPLDLVRNGVVANLLYSRYWAKRKRKAANGWPTNYIMDGEGTSVDDMIRSTARGLLITRFWYVRYVDRMIPSATGMTRDGLFLIENGRITRPVKQMRFNANLVETLNKVEMTGTPVRSYMLVPALKIRDFPFTSTTKFG